MSYGKVHDAYWESETIDALSDDAALLGLFLISGTHRNAIGCFKLGIGAITDHPRFGAWGIGRVSKALLEMTEGGFIARDSRTGWTFIRNALKHDPIAGYKTAAHAVALFLSVPQNTSFYAELRAKLEVQIEATKALTKDWKDPKGYPFDAPSVAKPSPLPLPEPLPSPLPQPSPKGETASPPPRDDVRLAFDEWNEVAGELGLPKAEALSPKRRRSLELRLSEVGADGWGRALAKIRGSPFLRGQNARKWRVTFDFLLQGESLLRVLEGKYDEAKSGADRFFEELTNGSSADAGSYELAEADDSSAPSGQLRPTLAIANR